MSPMRLIILAVAAISAIVAAILVRNLASMDSTAADGPSAPAEVIKEVEVSQIKVLVMRDDVRTGTLLAPDHFSWADWPESALNPAFFTQDTYPDAMETLTGSVVRIAMYAEEPVLPVKLVQKGETGFMAALLAPGMRAASVEISPESASAGFILPDDRVDIILTYEAAMATADGIEERTVTKTIMENARVLAIDQTFGDIDGIPTITGSTATLELNQKQAELMALAARTGEISLTLRSYADADWNEGNVKARVDMLETVETGGNNIRVYRNGSAAAGGSR